VAVSGYPGEVTPDVLTGVVVHSDMERTGHFSCSDPGVNRLYQNILWTQKANSIDVPTDCPQRDERMGWTGDAQYFGPTACYNYMAHGFYAKWLKDLAADQAPSGMVYHTVPDKLGSGGAFGWSDAAVMVPWLLYRRFGDERILEQQYESMKGWVDFQYQRSADLANLAWRGFGDWLAWEGDYRQHYSPGQPTDKDLLGTAYFYHVTDLFSRCAALLGRQEDAARYKKLAGRIREAFQAQFLTPAGRLSSGTQTAYAVSLSFGLLPEDTEKVAAGRLAANVNELGHIATGILGTRDISHALTDFGYPEEAYKLLFREEFPSWLYMVNMGATTIWERWDGLRPDTTFQKPQMNSFNHPALGSVGDWLYRKVAGIEQEPGVPGFKSIVIKPCPGEGLDWVKASYECPYGTIRCEWKKADGNFILRVEIPVNTGARIYVPSTEGELNVDGRQTGDPQFFREENLEYGFCLFEAGSGTYELATGFRE
jgi:alpha-L-rhamnosidase